MPQPPHEVIPLRRFASQPLAFLLPSQSAKPASQAPLHAPAAHVGEAMWLFEQIWP